MGGPIVVAIYLGQRQYREGVQRADSGDGKGTPRNHRSARSGHQRKGRSNSRTRAACSDFAAGVARLLGCSNLEIEALRAGALLHDIGKIAVPDYILQKPGKLLLLSSRR